VAASPAPASPGTALKALLELLKLQVLPWALQMMQTLQMQRMKGSAA
jgi:hypothetical protein